MKEPDFRVLLESVGELAQSAMVRRPHMKELSAWIKEVFSAIRDSDLPEKLRQAWRRLVAKAKDKIGVQLLAKEVAAVIKACRSALTRKAGKKDVLNAAATLMDSIKKDLRLPVAVEITWNAAREAVDVAKG